jgi:integral membrane protein
MMPESSIGKLRVWAYLEGGSLLALLIICMPLKYGLDIPEPTRYVGAAHGGLFIFYCIWLLVTPLELKWSIRVFLISFFAAFVPFGTFLADRYIFKKHLA